MKNHTAQDQWGNWFHNLGPHPRKELLKRLAASSASKIYRDTAKGTAVHVGYIVAGHWLTLFEVKPFEREAGR